MLEMNGVGERTSVRRPYSIGTPVRGLARPLIRHYNVAQLSPSLQVGSFTRRLGFSVGVIVIKIDLPSS